MTLIDWLVLKRLTARVVLVITVLFGMFALAESLDTWRFGVLTQMGGVPLAVLGIAIGAFRWSFGALPVTVLIGVILGVLDLQARREITIIKASGLSIWSILRTPVLAIALFGIIAALVGDSLATWSARSLSLLGPQTDAAGGLWLEQQGGEETYLLHARSSLKSGTELASVSFFMSDRPERDRIEAERALLTPGNWLITAGTRYRPDTRPEPVTELKIPTRTTAGDMLVRLTSPRDLTFLELISALSGRVADPALRNAVLTSLLRLIALPLLLTGSVLIGFAFTSGYRRTNRYGVAVLYGIVLGFVVYVITELANRAGFAGVLDPAIAAAGPAFVAIVIGLTVLLYKEDGRA